ncbi:DoxX family membrane protein [Algoriphagus sp.]|uniref:DoxX family membrane protein n=1 Tax=Algoriphagus sp. TaxID=1872435 RepID=UPI002721D7D4|nr:DoxX family membrane protein [Algoriphagus sp.]MDO8965049.1 DoxX family membrane protein [Algoriphagus sp.]MDP3201858.1 DoxX family membrane protein [Algoriphagus sp.]
MKNKILDIISFIFSLLLINGGLNKFLNYMPVPEDLPSELLKDNTALMEIEWLIPLVGLAEIVGGILIAFPKTRALGALVIFPVMVGVLLTHIFVAPSGFPIALVIWAVLVWIIYENRKRYFHLMT